MFKIFGPKSLPENCKTIETKNKSEQTIVKIASKENLLSDNNTKNTLQETLQTEKKGFRTEKSHFRETAETAILKKNQKKIRTTVAAIAITTRIAIEKL